MTVKPCGYIRYDKALSTPRRQNHDSIRLLRPVIEERNGSIRGFLLVIICYYIIARLLYHNQLALSSVQKLLLQHRLKIAHDLHCQIAGVRCSVYSVDL